MFFCFEWDWLQRIFLFVFLVWRCLELSLSFFWKNNLLSRDVEVAILAFFHRAPKKLSLGFQSFSKGLYGVLVSKDFQFRSVLLVFICLKKVGGETG